MQQRNRQGGLLRGGRARGSGRTLRQFICRIPGIAPFWFCLLGVGLLAASVTSAYAGPVERMDQGRLMAEVAEARGKLVLLNFFATWCPSCSREVRALSELRREYPRKDLILLGISMDDTEGPLLRFLEKHKPGYPVYLAGRGVASAFNVSGVPKTIVYNREGRRVHSTHGYVPAVELRRIVDHLLDRGGDGGK